MTHEPVFTYLFYPTLINVRNTHIFKEMPEIKLIKIK
jgi:hypothetical protein